LATLNELVEHSKHTKKLNFAIQLQSILRDALRQQQPKEHSSRWTHRLTFSALMIAKWMIVILEKITSEYNFNNLITSESTKIR